MSLALRPARADDAPALLILFGQYLNNTPTLDDFIAEEQRREPALTFWRVVAEWNGEVVGLAQLEARPSTPPSWLDALVVVDQAFRQRGIGGHLANALRQQAQALRLLGLETSVRDDNPQSRKWAEQQHFDLDFQRFESVLDVGSFDLQPFLQIIQDVESSGLRLVTLAELPGEDALNRLHALDNRVFLDTPDAPGRNPLSFERFRGLVAQNPQVPKEGVIVMQDDEAFAGLTVLMRQGQDLYTGLTGVDRGYRGRKVGLALKLRSIAYAQKLGVRLMRTNNHSQNAPMLAVNRTLGYVTQPGWWVMKGMV